MRNFSLFLVAFLCFSTVSIGASAQDTSHHTLIFQVPSDTIKNLAASPDANPPAPNVPAPVAATTPTPATPAPAAPVQLQPSNTTASSQNYVLESGDHIHLTVYGEDDLSGDYVVGESGYVALPLIGNIMAAKTNTHDLEDAIRAKLSNGYLHDPKVSIQLLNYRPFFILGEVAKPGSYPYVDNMNVLNAAALAGGYTYRASTSRITIIHANDQEKKERDAKETDAVMPGDIIKIPERYF